MPEQLSKYFMGIGAKRLSEVEVAPDISNQHEFNGIAGFKEIFGTKKIHFQGKFIYLADDRDQIIEDSGNLTWYDARENHPSRTEYRLYYSSSPVLNAATAGDLLIIGRTGPDTLAVIVAPQGSTSGQQLLWLFGLADPKSDFIISDLTEKKKSISFAEKYILGSLGIELPETAPDFLELLIRKFGLHFPTTSVFSEFARSTASAVSPAEDPDLALVTWLEHEEVLFRTFEKHIVAHRLKQGFGENGDDVDGFISFSLSVQNRRKSRAGFAFEHHLAQIFNINHILYSKGARTERNNKPDFLFPGISFYNDEQFDVSLLTMLGVKTSAKERWRQVLAEASRIQEKHLITLEPAISLNQTDEMKAQNLKLVLPQSLLDTYTPKQREEIITLTEFISFVRYKQKKI